MNGSGTLKSLDEGRNFDDQALFVTLTMTVW